MVSVGHSFELLPAEMTGELKDQSSISLIAGEALFLGREIEVEGTGSNEGLGYPVSSSWA